MTAVDNMVVGTKPTTKPKDPISVLKASWVRNEIRDGVGKARLGIEKAQRLGISLDSWADLSGRPRSFSETTKKIIDILTGAIEADRVLYDD
jgi:hypothetical protein